MIAKELKKIIELKNEDEIWNMFENFSSRYIDTEDLRQLAIRSIIEYLERE